MVSRIHPIFHNENFHLLAPENLATPAHSAATGTPLLYTDKEFRGMSTQAFLSHEKFPACQQEYIDTARKIADFVKNRAGETRPPISASTVESVQQNFATLISHLEDPSFFSTHLPVVYGQIKALFHELENMLHSEKLPLQKRLDTVITMAPQVGVCTGGLGTVVQEAYATLKSSTAGFRSAAYRVKLQMLDALILDYVRRHHRYHTGNEVHYANAYFNYLASDMHVPERLDPLVSIALPEISHKSLEACREAVLQKLAPQVMAARMAEDYLARVKSAQTKNIDVTRPIGAKNTTELFANMDTIRTAELDAEYDPDVPTNAFLIMNTEAMECEFPKSATALTLHFLDKLKRHELVNFDTTAALSHADGDKGGIRMLGNLFWRDHDGKCVEMKASEFLDESPRTMREVLGTQDLSDETGSTIAADIAQAVLEAHLADNKPISADWVREFHETFGAHLPKEGQYPLALLAVASGCAEILPPLLKEQGFDANAVDEDGNTQAMIAARIGRADVIALMQYLPDIDFNHKNKDGTTAAMMAARGGNANVLARLKTLKNVDLDLADNNDLTALMYAALDGKAEAVRELVGHCDLNARTAQGVTAAMIATLHGHANVIVELRGHADLNRRDDAGRTTAMHAAINGKANVMRELVGYCNLDLGDPQDRTAAICAAAHGHADVIIELREHVKLNHPDCNGVTAAMQAAALGHANVISELAGYCDLDYKGPQGKTAAIFAAREGRADVIDALEGHANFDQQDDYGDTVVAHAARHQQIEVLRRLVGRCNLDAKNKQDRTAVMFAAREGFAEVVDFLKDHVDLNARDNRGMTAAMHAIDKKRTRVIERICNSPRVDFNVKNHHTQTAAMMAAKYGYADILNLIKHRCLLDIQDDEGNTALMLAAYGGHLNAILAIQNDSNRRMKNLYGDTAADIVRQVHARHPGKKAMLAALEPSRINRFLGKI